MKGDNTIYLNSASIIEAVQMYFDNEFKKEKSPVVNSISKSHVYYQSK